MKYYLQFLFNIQILLVIMSSCHVIFSFPLYLELERFDNDYYIKSYLFFFYILCFLSSLLSTFSAISNKFLISVFSNNNILNIIVFTYYLTFAYFSTMQYSYSFIGFLFIGTFSIATVCFTAIVIIKKKQFFNSGQFFFVKSVETSIMKIIEDKFVYEGKHKDIEYTNDHVIFYGKLIKNNDVVMLEENFGKKLYELNEDEKITVFMYAIS